MDDRGTDEAAARARWLAELAEALRAAERLTSALLRWRSGSPEAVLLRTRIKAAKAEVLALQGAIGDREIDQLAPLWTLAEARGPRSDPIP